MAKPRMYIVDFLLFLLFLSLVFTFSDCRGYFIICLPNVYVLLVCIFMFLHKFISLISYVRFISI